MLCLLVAGIQSKAETSEKKYEKTYPKAGIEELVLSNQYGKMEIVQVDGDEIKVAVAMKVTAKSGVTEHHHRKQSEWYNSETLLSSKPPLLH